MNQNSSQAQNIANSRQQIQEFIEKSAFDDSDDDEEEFKKEDAGNSRYNWHRYTNDIDISENWALIN